MTGNRVLIAETDDADGRDLVHALLRRGYLPKVVSRGAAALRQVCSDAPPDVVLMGLALPDMDGVAALQRAKAIREPEFLPIIALSGGDPGRETLVRALRSGADDVVARPFHPKEVLARIEALLRIRATQDRLRARNQELERKSITDPLTGLFNRRYFDYRLTQELERSRRHGDPMALAVLDLDHFKHVNDRYGHGVGDQVLRTIARIIRKQLRVLDTCTRWGGEEFAAIMPNTDASGATVVCQRILRAIRACSGMAAAPLTIPRGGLEAIRLTGSIGVAVHFASRRDTADDLLQEADAALYRAKKQGRDRMCLALGTEGQREQGGRAATGQSLPLVLPAVGT
jgi:diguanylate cyclase (GGDEF)-like protein